MTSRYPVVLEHSEEGDAVHCPALPGCWSQGQNEKEALENIRVAISEYLSAIIERLRQAKSVKLKSQWDEPQAPRH